VRKQRGRLELIKAPQSEPAELCNTITPEADILAQISHVRKVPLADFPLQAG